MDEEELTKIEQILTELFNQKEFGTFKKYVDKLTGDEIISSI